MLAGGVFFHQLPGSDILFCIVSRRQACSLWGSLQQNLIDAEMAEKPNTPRGRPTANKVDQIPALPEHIAKVIFRAVDKKAAPAKEPKKKPN
jgi:hypothetical protein